MRWSTYPDLQTVDIPWLDSIPSTWQVKKFRYCFRESAEKNGDTPVGEMLSVSGYRGVEVKQYDDENRRRTVEELTDYRVVRVGQLAVNTMWLNYAGLGVSPFEGHISPAYRAYWIQPGFDQRFVNYLMRSSAYVDGYTALLAGIRPNSLQMSRSDLMDFPVLRPPLEDQRWIAAFLDRETAKIDALIAKQEQLIATLREDRTATITHAVTKGLDPDIEMKDTGVEWVGGIPQHWTVTRLGRLCRLISDGPHFSPSYVDEGVMFLSARNIRVDGWSLDDAKFISEADFKEFSRRVVPEVGDVLYTKGGTTGIARAVDLAQRFQVWVHVAVLKLHRDLISPEYLAYSLNSSGCYEQSQLYTRGATNQDLGLTRMIRILLALPPIDQQREIVDFLDQRCKKIDTLIAKANEVIETLREYRSALITDAVTGKIDVRRAA